MVNGMLLLHTVLSLSVCEFVALGEPDLSPLTFAHYYHVDPSAAFGFTFANRRKSFSRDKKKKSLCIGPVLPLLKRKSLELTSFITNKKKILSLAPARRRPKQDLSWPLSISCTLTIFVFILPAAFAVTVKQGNSKELYKKYKNLKGRDRLLWRWTVIASCVVVGIVGYVIYTFIYRYLLLLVWIDPLRSHVCV